MAARYARAGGGNWSTDATWSTTSGGAADTVAPTAADDVFLDASSGNVTHTGSPVCRSLNCTGYTGTYNMATITLNIGDATAGASNIALKFVAGMTISNLGVFNFISTSATVQDVDFAGKTTGAVNFNASSNGSWKYTGSHTAAPTSTVTLTKGSLDTNGQTCSWGFVDYNNSNVKSLTLGTSAITITGTGTTWNGSASNTTISAASSTITFSGAGVTFVPSSSTAFTFGTINATGSGQFAVNNSFNCTNFTRTGTAAKTDSLRIIIGNTLTCSGTCTLNSNSAVNRLLVFTTATGTTATINAATAVISNIVDFQDITCAGAATWTVAGTGATAIGDCGGNTGLTASSSALRTWTGTGGGNWSANAWSDGVTFDGTQNYATLGTMGNFGSNLGSGFYAKFYIITSSTSIGGFGFGKAGNQIIKVGLNSNKSETVSSGNIAVVIRNNVSSKLLRAATTSPSVTFNDGKQHSIEVIVLPATNSVTIKIDDVSQTMDYNETQSPSEFSNLSTDDFCIGAVSYGGVRNSFFACTLSNLYLGTSASSIYGKYYLNEGTGTSIADSSGNANTGTLTNGGGANPTWASGQVPLPQDDVIVAGNSGSISSDMPRLGRTVDWSGQTGSGTWAFSNTPNTIFGSLILRSGLVTSATQTLTLGGRSSYVITSAGVTLVPSTNINAPGGTYTLTDAFNCSGTVMQLLGALDSANYNLTIQQITATTITGNARNLTLGTSTVTCTATGVANFWNVSGNGSSTLSMASSTIVLLNTSASTRTFAGGGQTYGTLTYTTAGSTGQMSITGANSFATINFSDASNARTLKFTAATTTTIRNAGGFNVQGTSGKLMTVDSITAATHTLSSSGLQSCDYLSLTNSIATGGGSWYAGANSTNVSGNTGWIFTAAPALVSSGSGANSLQSKRNLQNLQRLG